MSKKKRILESLVCSFLILFGILGFLYILYEVNYDYSNTPDDKIKKQDVKIINFKTNGEKDNTINIDNSILNTIPNFQEALEYNSKVINNVNDVLGRNNSYENSLNVNNGQVFISNNDSFLSVNNGQITISNNQININNDEFFNVSNNVEDEDVSDCNNTYEPETTINIDQIRENIEKIEKNNNPYIRKYIGKIVKFNYLPSSDYNISEDDSFQIYNSKGESIHTFTKIKLDDGKYFFLDGVLPLNIGDKIYSFQADISNGESSEEYLNDRSFFCTKNSKCMMIVLFDS